MSTVCKWTSGGLGGLLLTALACATPEVPTPGPATVDLGHALTLQLPAGHLFAPQEGAARVLEASGSSLHGNLLGLVFSQQPEAGWFVLLRYEPGGYIPDDVPPDADALLATIHQGQAAMNPQRLERGFKPLVVSGWTQAPLYDRERHHLTWALTVREEGSPTAFVNLHTRVLGRHGHASLTLVVDDSRLEDCKPEVARLLAATRFNPGARYEDFQPGLDRVAGYGLAGLVVGRAAAQAATAGRVGVAASSGGGLSGAFAAGRRFAVVCIVAWVALCRQLLGRWLRAPHT